VYALPARVTAVSFSFCADVGNAMSSATIRKAKFNNPLFFMDEIYYELIFK
jgi:hypothetical protein